MQGDSGVQLAQLLTRSFDAMVESARSELARAGHPDLTVAAEFALQAIDAGADSAADLGRALDVSRQAAAKTIASLERSGYVERTADVGDARRKHLVVSERGREAIAVGAAGFEAAYQRWRRVVGDELAESVVVALRALASPSHR
ncbi:DNA-binding transcriptional regulator, MarR family [Rathayibacter oskolensis]|uniref:DNA-binding transcriptional regulator, MarR family n=1 Tax=Rathayibacter oskolensis TaxID=1891671 RepID=A0A1X7N5Y9_9MICO|nr:MarR family transcriptional regulator [Rathayibacter oskolensis]SMH32330.1 DNA-binding transcriptional regulator, MarR family [Rathayibacter oskolensis]